MCFNETVRQYTHTMCSKTQLFSVLVLLHVQKIIMCITICRFLYRAPLLCHSQSPTNAAFCVRLSAKEIHVYFTLIRL